MAAPAKQASSRWGSFISQAVAGVEAKLDNILADDYDDGGAPQNKESRPAAATPPPAPSPAKATPSMMFPTMFSHPPKTYIWLTVLATYSTFKDSLYTYQ